jgi:UDP-hydrolysing UDP-N-acetyl-D-glucosamine 2-epimerase
LHPVSRKPEITEQEIGSLLQVLSTVDTQIVFTAPNADSGSSTIRSRIHEFCQMHKKSSFVENLGSLNYLAMMREASAVVGNSSSALIEAPSFELPAVNIGNRQDGRTRAPNIIDVGSSAEEIGSGLARALDPQFRRSLKGLANPYGDGHAAERIVSRLEAVSWGEDLIMKRFFDVQHVANEIH